MNLSIKQTHELLERLECCKVIGLFSEVLSAAVHSFPLSFRILNCSISKS